MGWYDYNTRWYDPAVGRMMQVDPLAIVSQSLSSYHYANNNPVRFVDPTGMTSEPFEWQQGVSYDNEFVVDRKRLFQTPEANGSISQVSGLSFDALESELSNGGMVGGPGDPGVKAHHVFRAIHSSSSSGTQSGSSFLGELGEAFGFFLGNLRGVFTGDYPGPISPSGDATRGAIRVFVDITQSFNPLYSGMNAYAGFSTGSDVLGNASGGFSNAMSLLGAVPGVGGTAKGVKGAYTVYHGVDAAGVVRYVGITRRAPAIRFAEHGNALGTGRELLQYRVIPTLTNLGKREARVLEQTLINNYGLGNLLNKQNSIRQSKWLNYGVMGPYMK